VKHHLMERTGWWIKFELEQPPRLHRLWLCKVGSAAEFPSSAEEGGAKHRGGVDQEIDFLNKPPRRFAAPRLD
jgi:hypothetical protein